VRACLALLAIGFVIGCSDGAKAPTPVRSDTAGSAGQSAAGTGGAETVTGGTSNSGASGGSSGGAGSGGSLAGGAGDAPVAGSSAAPKTIGEIYCPAAAAPYPSPLAAAPAASAVPINPPGGIEFLEGPVWLQERGVLLLSEWNDGHRILQLTPPQAVEVFLPTSRSNGLIVTPDAQSLLMVREEPDSSLSRVSLANKAIEPLVEDYEGTSFVQPNDLATRADGTLFFTDYQAGRLYRRAIDGSVSLVASHPHANGVAISPDETALYLNSDALTIAFPLSAQSDLGESSNLATGLSGADGLAIDCAGNVYIAQNQGGALVVVSAAGDALGEIGDLPQTVTNAAFGGPERKTLYITTNSALYAVELPVPGLPY
jgi:gluconolactonase